MEPEKKEEAEAEPEAQPSEANPNPVQPSPEPVAEPVRPEAESLNAFGVQSHNQQKNISAKKASSKRVLLIVGLILLILVGIAAVYFLVIKKDAPPAKAPVSNSQPTKTTPAVATSGITWLTAPKALDDQKLFVVDEYTKDLDIKYYQTGTAKDGSQLITATWNEAPGTGSAMFMKKDGNVALLALYSPNAYSEKDKKYSGPDLIKSVTIDTTTEIPELTKRAELDLDNVKGALERTSIVEYVDFIADPAEYTKDPTKYKKLTTDQYGTLYKVTTDKDAVSELSNYVLIKPNFDSVTYRVKAPLSFAKDSTGAIGTIPTITWSDNSTNKDSYIRKPAGCSIDSANIVALDLSDSDVKKIGTTDSSDVYQVANYTNSLEATFYKEYQELTKDYDKDEFGVLVGQTAKQYHDKRAIILVKDSLGHYQVFVNEKFAVAGGCGKPVIYLYPTKSTNVSVKVDANVVKSDPSYGNGWLNVLARPDGQLRFAGKQYDSLFWEGYGHGTYPDVSKTGVVVTKSELYGSLTTQLKTLGLNTKEQQDFMDFWWPKMPDAPYTRLTWLKTSQMNALAPLHITPQPDTMIRVFLDFEGLQQPVNLQPQKLNSIPRQGFTVVEWGGLLRNGIR